MTTDTTSTQLCNSCQTPVAEYDAVYCRVCGKVHHASCWNDAGHCATPECPGIQAVRMQSTGMGLAPPPPVTSARTSYSTIPGFINDVGLGACLTNGWNAFRDNMGLCIGTLVIGILLMIPVAIIPIVNILILPVLFGGVVIFGLNVINRNNPGIGDLFAGFQNFGRWLGAILLHGLIMMLPMLPAIAWVVTRTIQTEGVATSAGSGTFDVLGAEGPIYYLLYLGGMAVMYYLQMRWYFYHPLIAEGAGIMEAFGKSVEMTEGIRWRLFGITIVLGLIYLAGFFTCIGWLFALPLVCLAYISLYIAAKNQQSVPQF